MNGTITPISHCTPRYTHPHSHIFLALVGNWLRLAVRRFCKGRSSPVPRDCFYNRLHCLPLLPLTLSRLQSFYITTYRTSVPSPKCRKMNSLIRASSQTHTQQIITAAICMASKQVKSGIYPPKFTPPLLYLKEHRVR